MQFGSTIVAIAALALNTASGASVQKRIPILGGFTLSTTAGCPMSIDPNTEHITIGYGQACGDCVPVKFWNNDTFKTITGMSIDPKCQLTLFNTPDCSNGGIPSGPNCWTPEGGIAAYSVSCPSWPDGPTWENLKPCYN